MVQKWVYNPETGRAILEGGATHKRLRASGTRSFATAPAPKHGRYYRVPHVGRTSKSRSKSHRSPSSRSVSGEIAAAEHRKQPPYMRKKLATLKRHVGQGRGSAQRGWSAVKPKTQGERREMYARCGQKCFLAAPIRLSNGQLVHKFPICRVGTCQVDQRGVLAAQSRAHGTATRMAHRGEAQVAAAYQGIGDRARSLRSGGHYNGGVACTCSATTAWRPCREGMRTGVCRPDEPGVPDSCQSCY